MPQTNGRHENYLGNCPSSHWNVGLVEFSADQIGVILAGVLPDDEVVEKHVEVLC